MGAALNVRTYRTAEKATIKKSFAAACEEARYEDGHGGYTGTIAEMSGIKTWRDLKLSEDEAEEFIADNHQKYGGAMAVSFKNDDGPVGWVVGGWCSE